MPPVLFYIFSAITLGFGLAVILNRNPVGSAFCMVVSFLGLAALFISLDAFFIGIIQILVYAGAIMVLFVFIIMLLDLKVEEKRPFNLMALGGGLLVGGFFLFQFTNILGDYTAGGRTLEPLPEKVLEDGVLNDVEHLGNLLFTNYNFPLQVVAVLLLVSTIGVVVLSKKELK